ncbi:ABC transporter ATP-binding protein [Pseudomarimonas salicorniae]|uniref:ABC transporter ATP-binding protein n=1 Tax=Pseudomarimonas salicorniae TaxID=2933270 RepID=A0ABT0GIC0_9GAMM|nr:ABC transporter ATP-binding protein [Lysobacter sp. CAU 1642]MCK7593730.1 ABC transporter ATP-binding protein [Lysobacter sp. CAU 1642]
MHDDTRERRGVGLEVESLHKGWGGQAVLVDLSFGVGPGEFVAVVGRSGSGKSTLLHLLAGIDRPDAGRIILDGVDIATLDENARCALRRKHIGLVFQSGNLVPTLGVLDNLRLPLELNGVAAAESRRRAQAMLDALGLAALSAREVSALSGGEQQRVAIGRALVHEPALVLADEPTAALDADNAQGVLDLLQRACRERGASLVMATHAQEVMGRADRLLRLERGQLVDA